MIPEEEMCSDKCIPYNEELKEYNFKTTNWCPVGYAPD